MNNDEILKRSRQQKQDEGMEHTENNGRKLGFIAFCCVFLFEVIFNSFLGEQSYAIFALFWTFIAAEAIPKYRFTQKKACLITIIAGFIAAAASLAGFVSVR
ncbi:DUF6442 family protein [Tissierella sp.]|uniref:DUF6442 family protein n=1 Tax=Tissierella sp. TaxID=41274 RepID=UPI0028AC836F|nr:DUF6442 family protein [Tissierella sp.]